MGRLLALHHRLEAPHNVKVGDVTETLGLALQAARGSITPRSSSSPIGSRLPNYHCAVGGSLRFAYTDDRWNVLQVYDAIGQIPPKNDV
jgi:hypothetical protein